MALALLVGAGGEQRRRPRGGSRRRRAPAAARRGRQARSRARPARRRTCRRPTPSASAGPRNPRREARRTRPAGSGRTPRRTRRSARAASRPGHARGTSRGPRRGTRRARRACWPPSARVPPQGEQPVAVLGGLHASRPPRRSPACTAPLSAWDRCMLTTRLVPCSASAGCPASRSARRRASGSRSVGRGGAGGEAELDRRGRRDAVAGVEVLARAQDRGQQRPERGAAVARHQADADVRIGQVGGLARSARCRTARRGCSPGPPPGR